MDYHFVYKDVEGASTQWDDIQRKLGNLPAKAPPYKPPPFTPAEDDDSKPKDKSWIDQKTEEELSDLEDEPDLDDDRFLHEYRLLFSQFLHLVNISIFCFGCFGNMKSWEKSISNSYWRRVFFVIVHQIKQKRKTNNNNNKVFFFLAFFLLLDFLIL